MESSLTTDASLAVLYVLAQDRRRVLDAMANRGLTLGAALIVDHHTDEARLAPIQVTDFYRGE